MVAWSLAAHVGIVAFVLLVPDRWRRHADEAPRTVMTISLGGAPGPRAGGMTPMGGRAVQAPPPEAGARAETPPAPKPPEMTLPDPNVPAAAARPKRAAGRDGRTPTTGAEPQEGPARDRNAARAARASA